MWGVNKEEIATRQRVKRDEMLVKMAPMLVRVRKWSHERPL